MRLILLVLCLLVAPFATAVTLPGTANSDNVIVSGDVPDVATRDAILQQLWKVYGKDKVISHMQVGGVSTPANWGKFVTSMITPSLKNISHGSVTVKGNNITVAGTVKSQKKQENVINKIRYAFNANYAVTSSVKVVEPNLQAKLDKTLDHRTVEFESGSAILTDEGKHILDEMADTIKKMPDPFIQIVGNTDNVGKRMNNIRLSLQRAMSVKQYLVSRGISAGSLSVSGMGPDNPIASNDTKKGRARNRRIDFRVTR